LGSHRARSLRCTIALAGAWLPIVFSSAVLLPQQIERLIGDDTWSATYATVSALGWLTVVIGLTLSGHLRDAGRLERDGDRRTLRSLAVAVLITGSALPLADSVPVLAVLWVVALAPAAVSVTLLAARAADSGSTTLASASAIGSAPLLAVLLGAIAVTVAPWDGDARSVMIAVLAALALLTAPGGADGPPALDTAAPPPLPVLTDPLVRRAVGRHRRLLVAVALVDTGTVTLTFSIVPLVFLLPRSEVARPGSYAELLVLIATVCSLVAVWLGPRLGRVRERPRSLFAVTALLTATALFAAPFAGPEGLVAVALLAGAAIGASNAATFGLFLSDPASTQQRATGLGLLNAVPSVPAALVPLAAIPLLRWSPSAGLVVLMFAAAVAAALGAVVVSRGPAERTTAATLRIPEGRRGHEERPS
jgi:MFS family permease